MTKCATCDRRARSRSRFCHLHDPALIQERVKKRRERARLDHESQWTRRHHKLQLALRELPVDLLQLALDMKGRIANIKTSPTGTEAVKSAIFSTESETSFFSYQEISDIISARKAEPTK